MAKKRESKRELRKQRDRFVAFAFASADLFLEVSPKGKIKFALGASKSLTGYSDTDLVGKNWLGLFDPAEQARMIALNENAVPGLRVGPFLINLDQAVSGRKGILTGIKLPNKENFYVTLGLSNILMDKLATMMEESGFDDTLYNQGNYGDDEKFDDSQYGKAPPPDEKFDDSVYNQGDHPDLEKFDDSQYGKNPGPDDEKFDDSVYNQGDHPDAEKFDDSQYGQNPGPDVEEKFDDSVYNQGDHPDAEKFDDSQYGKNPGPDDEKFDDSQYGQNPGPDDEKFDDSQYGKAPDSDAGEQFDDSQYGQNPGPDDEKFDDSQYGKAPPPSDEEQFDDSQYGKNAPAPEEEFDDSQYGKNVSAEDKEFADEIFGQHAQADEEEFDDSLYNKQGFLDNAEDAFQFARTHNKEAEVTVFDFGRTQEIPEENWAEVYGEMSKYLRGQSIDGKSAGEISDGHLSLIHDSSINPDEIREYLGEIFKKNAPEGKDVEVKSKTIKADMEEMGARKASRALLYTINEFERTGLEDMAVESLDEGLKTYGSDNKQRTKELKDIIERQSFATHFHPVIDLKTKEALYYEILCRFDSGDTKEWIMFAEDAKLIAQLDQAVCERAINYIKFKAGNTRTPFAINISSLSYMDAEFVEELMERLERNSALANRLIFEITDSYKIKDIDKTSRFFANLQNFGCQIALDDFGSSSSFEDLQTLNVNYVKIDGKHVRGIHASKPDILMVKKLVDICRGMGVKVIAEQVEKNVQVAVLGQLGVKYAQGFLFSKPESRPAYVPI